jgi:hypothetical protein
MVPSGATSRSLSIVVPGKSAGNANSVTCPDGVTLPTLLASSSVNHMVPSGAVTIRPSPASLVGTGMIVVPAVAGGAAPASTTVRAPAASATEVSWATSRRGTIRFYHPEVSSNRVASCGG